MFEEFTSKRQQRGRRLKINHSRILHLLETIMLVQFAVTSLGVKCQLGKLFKNIFTFKYICLEIYENISCDQVKNNLEQIKGIILYLEHACLIDRQFQL